MLICLLRNLSVRKNFGPVLGCAIIFHGTPTQACGMYHYFECDL